LIPLFINALSSLELVTVAGSSIGFKEVVSVAASLFTQEELVKARIALVELEDI
jgi:hypothetical protein